MANVFDTVSNGEDIVATQVQQILNVIMGATGGDIPLYLTRLNESALVNLTLQNLHASGKPLVIYAANGTTKLLEIQPTKPTVTGSRGGNAAVTSLLTALASLQVITDSTTS